MRSESGWRWRLAYGDGDARERERERDLTKHMELTSTFRCAWGGCSRKQGREGAIGIHILYYIYSLFVPFMK